MTSLLQIHNSMKGVSFSRTNFIDLKNSKKTDEVTTYYDDHKTNERITVNETGRELMKKRIIHIPETGFRIVRYYGFYNNKEQDILNRVHELSG